MSSHTQKHTHTHMLGCTHAHTPHLQHHTHHNILQSPLGNHSTLHNYSSFLTHTHTHTLSHNMSTQSLSYCHPLSDTESLCLQVNENVGGKDWFGGFQHTATMTWCAPRPLSHTHTLWLLWGAFHSNRPRHRHRDATSLSHVSVQRLVGVIYDPWGAIPPGCSPIWLKQTQRWRSGMLFIEVTPCVLLCCSFLGGLGLVTFSI